MTTDRQLGKCSLQCIQMDSMQCATCVSKGVFLHVGLLVKSLVAVLARIWSCVGVNEYVGGQR